MEFSLPIFTLPAFSKTTFHSGNKIVSDAGHTSTQREHSPKENSTILEKLSDLFLVHSQEENVTDGNFIKCDYLEELVQNENLNYTSIACYSTHDVFSVKYGTETLTREFDIKVDDEFYTSINNQEIPFTLVAELCRPLNWEIMYHYHVILEVQMLAPVHTHNNPPSPVAPLFSTFVLLKPICKVLTYCIFNELRDRKIILDDGNTDVNKCKVVNEYESEILSKISIPLFLCTDEVDVVERVFKKFYIDSLCRSLFESSSHTTYSKNKERASKKEKNHRKRLKINQETTEEESAESVETEERLMNPPNPMAALERLLESRTIYDPKVYNEKTSRLGKENYYLVETFTFEYKNKIGESMAKLEKDEVSVYVKNDNFYTHSNSCDEKKIKVEKQKNYWYHLKSREMLDEYLMSFAAVVSQKFCDEIHIKHKNACDDKEKLFFVSAFKDIIEEEKQACAQELQELKNLKTKQENEKSSQETIGESDSISQTTHLTSNDETCPHTMEIPEMEIGDFITKGFQGNPYQEEKSFPAYFDRLPKVEEENHTTHTQDLNEEETSESTWTVEELWSFGPFGSSIPLLKRSRKQLT